MDEMLYFKANLKYVTGRSDRQKVYCGI